MTPDPSLPNSETSDTLLCHAGRKPEEHSGAVNPPVYHASTILFPTLAALDAKASAKVRYGRRGTPTTHALQDAMSELEQAHGTVLAPSGVMAITVALMSFAEQGAHILVTDSAYGPVRHFCNEVLSKLGVRTSYYDPSIGAGIEALIEPQTRLIWLESPGSLTFEVQDLPAIIGCARRHGVATVVDNTWSGGYFLKPLAMGASVSVQAATKYVSGHSDVMIGTVACAESVLERVRNFASRAGVCVGPDDIYLTLRGLRTLGLRLRQHHHSALEVARWLAGRPEVSQVLCPALPDDPGHALWRAQFTGASGLFGFSIHETDRRRLAAMMDGLRYFGMGSSWGGFESLLIPTNPDSIRSLGRPRPPGQLMRIHVGLESVGDLIADLDAGFERLRGA